MPRPKQRSAAKKKFWANSPAKANLSQSPNGSASVEEVDEKKQETISPLVQPSPKKARHAIDLSNRDPVHEPLVQPSAVISVQASRSQAHNLYPNFSRNKQCTCMSLTFLAQQNEGLELRRDDLNKILDMGDRLYRRTINRLKRRNLFQSKFLSMEETPLDVETEHNHYSVIKSNVETGYMREAGDTRQQHWLLNLHARLQCLSADVTHALLTISPYTIAVFRDASGRYGMFDPHSRNDDGLPLAPWKGGTAVMMTFTHLDDLIAKIDHLTVSVHSIPIDRMQFDFMPVTFVQTNAPSPHVETNAPSPSTSRHETNTGPSSTKPSLQSGISSPTEVGSNTSSDTFHKLNKRRRRKLSRKTGSQKPTTRRQTNTIEDIRARNKEYIRKYRAKRCIIDTEFKAKQKGYNSAYFQSKYSKDLDFKGKELQKHKYRYKMDEVFREKRKAFSKAYDNSRYHTDEKFRGKRKAFSKAYVNRRFHVDEEFREKLRQHMKFYMAHKCKTDAFFKMRRDMRQALKLKRRYMELCRVQLRLRVEDNKRRVEDRRVEKEARKALQEKQLQDCCIAKFHADIEDGPTFVCTTCHRALFSGQVDPCHREKYKTNPDVVAACLTGKYVHFCDDECGGPEDCTVPKERHREWICKCCHRIVLAGRMPDIAVANNLELAAIPPELCQLNVLERQMTALDIPFAKILTLPKGKQGAVHGAVVCVPSNVETTINALPRRLDSSGLYRVKLKRRLRYKGHHLFHTVNVRNVVLALRKLIETHPDYRNITIRDEDDISGEAVVDPLEELPASEQTATDDGMDSCDEAEMMEVADSTEALDSSRTVDQHPPSAEDEQDVLRPGHGLDSCLQPDDIGQDMMTYGDGIFTIAPAEGNKPVSYSTVPNLEAKAFPTLFPTGENTFDRKRRVKLSPSRYFNARLFGVDARFARDQTYLFFAQFVSETHLAKNTISIQLRKGKPKTKDGRRINNKMLQNKSEVERLVKNRDATRFMSPMRGTPAYWQKTMLDLFAMVRQIGPPTFFLTISAAEFRWPEVIKAIKAQQGQIVDFDKLDWNDKCDILRSNAVTTMRMFDKRVSSYYRNVLFDKEALPIGRVIDWFHRVEYQARGSPHLHCLMWIADAPVYGEDSDEKICEFADRYINCQLPDPNEDPILYKIVTEVQMHSRNHTKSCRKGRKTCRFGFPKPPVDKTWITNPTPVDPIQEELEKDLDDGATAGNDAANKSARKEAKDGAKGLGKKRTAQTQAAMAKLKPLFDMLIDGTSEVTDLADLLAKCNLTREEYNASLEHMRKTHVLLMKRGVKDGFVNNYNPVLLKAWNANMDIQFVLDHYVCISYMLSYISKAESEMGELLKQVVVGIDPTKVSERDAMNQLVHSYVKNRQVSAQEAVARTCSLHLKKCSRQVIFLPTDDNAMRMSLPLSTLQKRPDDSEHVWMTHCLDRYNVRPKSPEFDNMCLAEFASDYRVVYGDEATQKDCVKLSDNMGTMRKRKKVGYPAVIRYAKFSEQKEPEKYYGTLLKVYLPHRYQTSLKTETFPSYTEFYHNASVRLPGTDEVWGANIIVARNRKKFEKHSESIEEAMEEFLKNGPAEDAWADIAAENELDRLECLAQQDEIPLDDEERDDVPEFSAQDVPNIGHVAVSAPQVSLDHLLTMCRNLNQTQASIFHSVRDWCLKSVNEQNPDPFFYFVTGGAGTGKSHMIRCVYGEGTRILRRLPRLFEDTDPSTPTVLLSAFTGTAAYNISGNTLHSLLKLPRSLKPPYTGLGNRLDDMRAKLGNAQIIVIDEVSMISKDLFAFVHWRLQEIKGSKMPFGGMSVLAVGDFHQLPPTSQGKPLCVLEECKPDLLHEHFQMITLTEIMRQKDDVPYAELLNRLRVKGKKDPLSVADKDLLAQRVTERHLCPKDVVHIFATNKEVAAHNIKSLSELHTHIVDIPAEDYRRDERNHQMTRLNRACTGQQKDLLDNLQVAEGAPVMIIRNIDVEDGLVNGTFGKIDSVEYLVNQDGTTVAKLWLLLDKPDAGLKYRTTTPGAKQVHIIRVEEYLSDQKVIRRQFPIKLAYACTAHKVQGMTTQSAVVSLKRIFQPGMAYVALSRTTSLQGLHIIDFDEKKIYADPEITAALESMKTASLDSVMPLLHFRERMGQAQTLTIVHHNTQSLRAHIQDIRQHHEFPLADVLCLTETHLTGSVVDDGLQLDGYTMFSRNRHVSYASNPDRAEQNGGGVAVYVKDHFQASERRNIFNVTNMEFVVVKIESPVKLLIAAVYRPPRYGDPFLDNLKALLDGLEIMDHHPIVLCGDFNEDLLQGPTFGGPISRLLDSRGYAQLIKEATTDKNTLLDHMYISRPQQCLQSGVLRTYYSYHNPVYCVLSSEHE